MIMKKSYILVFVCFIFTLMGLFIKLPDNGSQQGHANINVNFSKKDRKFYPWKDDYCKSLAVR